MWQILLTQLLIPELARVLEARWAAGQPPPTAAEILVILKGIVKATVDEGNAFLVSKGEAPVAPLPAPPPPQP